MADTLKQRPEDQPLPVPNSRPDVQSQVIADIEARRQVGISRYGTALQPFNGRDMLRDAYEEAMDLATYLRGVIAERDDVDGIAAVQARLAATEHQLERVTDVLCELQLQIKSFAKADHFEVTDYRTYLWEMETSIRHVVESFDDDRHES